MVSSRLFERGALVHCILRNLTARRLVGATLAAASMMMLCRIATPGLASSGGFKTVTNSDSTASIGLPSGWTFAKGSNGFVYVTGPHDERINLGVIVIGKNSGGANVPLSLPFTASPRSKFTAIIQHGAQMQGLPTPQITFAQESRTRLPMCSLFLGGWTAGPKSWKFEGILCSLHPDYLGFYKNIVYLAQVPSSRAADDRALVEKIVTSYRVTPAMFKQMIAPYTALPRLPSGSVRMMPGMAPYQDPTNSDCFDYNVIRESPPWEMPMHCGGLQPG